MTTRTIAGLREVADRYQAFYVDQFGVMHDGTSPLPGAVEALTRLTGAGKRVIVLTNSGKRADANIDRVVALGFPPESFSTLISSGEVAHDALKEGSFSPPFRAGGRAHIIGREDDDYGFGDLGLQFTDDPAQAEMLLIMGSNYPRTSLEQYQLFLAGAAANGVPALCCNPDTMMVTRNGPQPGPGAIAHIYERLGGAVTYIGKPHSAIYRAAARSANADAASSLAIGDSLDHDVYGAAQLKIDTLLVRTGVASGLSGSQFAAALAAAPFAPTFIAETLRW